MKRFFSLALAFVLFVGGGFTLSQAQSPQVRQIILTKQNASAAAPSVIAFVSGTNAGSADGIVVTTSAIDTTGANFIEINISNLDFFPIGVITDSKGNSSPVSLTPAGNGFCRSTQYYYVAPTVGSGHTFTFTTTGGLSGNPSIGVAAFSGVSASPFDVENGAGATSINPSARSITPTQNNELIVAGVCARTVTIDSIDSGFNIVGTPVVDDGNHLSAGIAYFIQSIAGAVNPIWTLSSGQQWAATVASFKKQ